MAFRDRGNQHSDWDFEADLAPPIWDEPSPAPRSARGRDQSLSDLPAWSNSNRSSDSDWDDVEPTPRASRPAPRDADPYDRHAPATPWPSLRDSLRGNAGTTSASQRAARLNPQVPAPAIERRQPRPVRHQYDDEPWQEELESGYYAQPEVAYDEPQRQAPRRANAAATTRTQTRARRAVTTPTRPNVQLASRLGSLTAGQDPTIFGTVGISVLSLLAMAVTVSLRSDALPPWIPIHLDAAGNTDRWATTETIWRLPLMTVMLTLASLAGALYLGRRDAFAARFLLGSTLLIHLLGWFGLISILW